MYVTVYIRQVTRIYTVVEYFVMIVKAKVRSCVRLEYSIAEAEITWTRGYNLIQPQSDGL